jgi:hypothetical protein
VVHGKNINIFSQIANGRYQKARHGRHKKRPLPSATGQTGRARGLSSARREFSSN